jgi:type IV secretion system protein TrbI
MPRQDTDSASAGLRMSGDRPAGVVPRKTQQYIILGVAVLLVLISLFSSHGARATNKAATDGAMPDPTAPNASEIAAYQQQLQNLQRAAEGGAPLPGAIPSNPASGAQTFAQPSGAADPAPRSADPPPVDPIKAEQQQRAYDSLFASNIALSYRPGENVADATDPAPDPPTPNPTGNAIDAQIQQVLAAERLASPAIVPAAAPVAAKAKPLTPQAPTTAPPNNIEASSPGETYVLQEGTIVPTVLLNRLVGDFSGPVECMVSNDVYSTDRQQVLIPSGSKVLGEARQVAGFGQRRLAVMFHRLILPNGASFTLDNLQGLDQTGATGLHDQVNNHYLQIFGASMAIGILGAASELSESETTATGRALFLEGVGSGMSQASMQVLDKFLNIMPTITIREGHRVDIYLASDLLLPAYRTPAASVQPGGGPQ